MKHSPPVPPLDHLFLREEAAEQGGCLIILDIDYAQVIPAPNSIVPMQIAG